MAALNGAQAVIRTLVGAGVDVCFANPGTSHMHFLASNVSGWVRRSSSVGDVGADAAAAVVAAMGPPGQVATLILPADLCWSEGASEAAPAPLRSRSAAADDAVAAAAKALASGEPV